METKDKAKEFDAVKMMREIRDKISDETQGIIRPIEKVRRGQVEKVQQENNRTVAPSPQYAVLHACLVKNTSNPPIKFGAEPGILTRPEPY